MKRLTDLDRFIPHPDSDDPDQSRRPTEDQKKATGTLRRFLRVMFLNIPPTGLEQSDRNAQIALKLRQEGDCVDFEDAEFNAIFESVRANPMQWPGHIHSYVVQKLREAEKRKIEITISEQK